MGIKNKQLTINNNYILAEPTFPPVIARSHATAGRRSNPALSSTKHGITRLDSARRAIYFYIFHIFQPIAIYSYRVLYFRVSVFLFFCAFLIFCSCLFIFLYSCILCLNVFALRAIRLHPTKNNSYP
jgi:hypothetical protein